MEKNQDQNTEKAVIAEVEELRFFYDLMSKSNLLELETESSLGKLVLKRSYLEQPAVVVSSPVGHVAAAPRRKDQSDDKKESSHAAASALKTINSPITGVFYRSSSPQSAPFCKEGQVIKTGQTLCIVEAMKVMNEVKSEAGCKIVKTLVENAKPVTQGQPLFSIEPV